MLMHTGIQRLEDMGQYVIPSEIQNLHSAVRESHQRPTDSTASREPATATFSRKMSQHLTPRFSPSRRKKRPPWTPNNGESLRAHIEP